MSINYIECLTCAYFDTFTDDKMREYFLAAKSLLQQVFLHQLFDLGLLLVREELQGRHETRHAPTLHRSQLTARSAPPPTQPQVQANKHSASARAS